jgi:protein dithiol oxidoreductase (disulfide-forming)
MKRREFSRYLSGGGLGLVVTGLARAQGAPVEGQQYVRLNTPAPVTLSGPDKKVDVIEFFWYGCPHCNVFEPLLEAWTKRLAPDVSFRRVHVGFGQIHQVHQRLFYALEEMGELPALHKKVFAAIHAQGRRLATESDMAAFVKENGVDPAKFLEAYKSFAVNTKATRARQLTDAYKIDGVPAMGVQGRYYTSGALTGTHERMLQVVDYLIQRSRA